MEWKILVYFAYVSALNVRDIIGVVSEYAYNTIQAAENNDNQAPLTNISTVAIPVNDTASGLSKNFVPVTFGVSKEHTSGIRPNKTTKKTHFNHDKHVKYTVSTQSFPYDAPFDQVASFWNDNSTESINRLRQNNCYHFATNMAANVSNQSIEEGFRGFAQPGRAHNIILRHVSNEKHNGTINCDLVKSLAEKDGLTFVTNKKFEEHKDRPTDKCHYVALVVQEGTTKWDYHWYRWEPTHNSFWHKPGHAPASNVDGAKRLITNIDDAIKGTRYNRNCGYMKVCDGKVAIL